MGQIIPTITDYSTPCGNLPLSFIQMLAATLVNYTGEDGEEHAFINVLTDYDYCDDLTDFFTCANQNLDPERALVENAFGLDECGRLGIKMFWNYGTR